MRAPVWYHAVAAVRRITTATVAFNRMKWNAGRDREFIDLKDESIVRRERVDAIWHAIELHSGWIRRRNSGQGRHRNAGQENRRFNQHRANPSDPIAGHVGA